MSNVHDNKLNKLSLKLLAYTVLGDLLLIPIQLNQRNTVHNVIEIL